MHRLELPPPDGDAAEHGTRVAGHVAGRIDAAGGAIPFSEYMDLVLYAPGLGYYSAGSHKLGADGDYVTAPERSSLFARCLAMQVAEVFKAGGGDTVLEAGAGSGRMAADLLVALDALDSLPARYLVLETSADLRSRQRDTLAAAVPGLAERVQWLDAWPAPVDGVILGNEVLDALPFECFVKRGGAAWQRTVVRAGDGFGWGERPAPADLAAAVAAIERDCGGLPDGYASEVRLQSPVWIGSAAACLARGVMLFTDYGMPRRELYMPERSQGTLMCHYRHRAHDDPFVWPGLQDITAQVDFTAVAEAGEAAGLSVAGYTTQALFLLGCGLDRMLGGVDPVASFDEAQQAKALTLPGEMGERFKAIALTRGYDGPLSGFSFRDLRSRLA